MPETRFRTPEDTVPLPWDRLANYLRVQGFGLEENVV